LTGKPGPPVGRRFLRTAFRYRPGHGWEQLPDMPRAAEAGFAVAEGHDVLLIGGSDGVLADREFELKGQHPGFCRDVLRYSPDAKRWSADGEMPASLVTSGIVRWGDEWVIAGGEDRPADRSARVLGARKK
jgi:N-acetylneuraminate epimerase